jgi:hypothetical protein
LNIKKLKDQNYLDELSMNDFMNFIEENKNKAKNNNRESLSEVLLKIDLNIKNSNQEKLDIFADLNVINLYNEKDANLKNINKILYNNFYKILSDLRENKIYFGIIPSSFLNYSSNLSSNFIIINFKNEPNGNEYKIFFSNELSEMFFNYNHILQKEFFIPSK